MSNRDDDNKRRGGGQRAGRVTRAFKALCPDPLIAAIIGHQGNVRKQLEQDTGAHIKMSNREEYYPGTRCRVLLATGNDTSQILSVLEAVVHHTVEVANAEAERGKGGHNHRENSEALFGKEPGEYILRAALPKVCTGAIIGTRGSRIQNLRETTGAKVFVENESHDGHQMVRIIGQPESINLAMPQICSIIDEEFGEDKMADWAKQITFDGGFGNEKGSNKGTPKGKGKEDYPRASKGRGRSRSRNRDNGPYDDYARYPDDQQGPVDDGFNLDAVPHRSAEESCQLIQQVMAEFDPSRIEAAHSVSCDLPRDCIPALVGRRRQIINDVQQATGANIILEKEGTDENMQTIHFQGPLLAVYAAHLMMMKRYHEEEAAKERRAGGGDQAAVASLQQQLADLQRQLNEVRGDKGGKGKGGGKGRR